MPYTDFEDLSISIAQAERYAKEHFGLNTSAKKLPGEVDFNFYLKEDIGTSFCLKISRPDIDKNELDFQSKLIQHLVDNNFPYQIPSPIPALDGSLFKQIKDDHGQERWIRLQKWVGGRMLDEVNPRTPKLLQDWGQLIGKVAFALKGFDHPAAHRTYKWNPSETLLSKKYQRHISGKEESEIAQYFWHLFESTTLAKLSHLRKSVNYNDAHEHNILVNHDLKKPTISGLIDFGDALYTYTINEVAIAGAYAGMYAPDPLSAVAHLVRGFHEVFPLEENELEALYSLISARLMITVANAAWNKHNEPDNEYLVISEKPAWDLLKKWRNISPGLAHYTFREACGFVPCAQAKYFEDYVKKQENSFAPVIKFDQQKMTSIDLSVGSLDLGNNSNFENIQNFEKSIRRFLEDKKATIAYGGYGEVRPIYTTDAYQEIGNAGVQWRSVHLGMDFWTAVETPVFAALDGKVHSFNNNEGDCNYGPTIILEHKVSDNFSFYTLYGHLSLHSLYKIEKGMAIQKGQKIGSIGMSKINGNWPPHLHFQIILDLLENDGDFPGVAFPNEKNTWLSICPDPSLLFKTVQLQNKKTPISTKDILQTRQQHLGKSLSISYQRPLHMVRGYHQYLYDHTGRRYLDTVNNVAHVGHEHAKVVRAAQRQNAVLNTNTRYLNHNITNFAKELLSTFPPELSVVHFVNSGSEANELALRMAKIYSGQNDMLAIEVGYHGNTGACIDISSYKFDGKGGQGAPPHTHILPIPDVYRGLYRHKNSAKEYAAHAQEIIKTLKKAGKNIAGFIGESILSCGGQVMLPDGYLEAIYQMVRNEGGLCIADEVQVGFGRTGEKFWAFELQGVIPDIVTMGKPIGNGHPLAAVVTTQKVAEKFANGMEFFNTFGGNPVSCAVGSAVLQVVDEEELQQNALKVGNYLLAKLRELQSRFPIIGDVRGIGFFLGFELVQKIKTLEPAAEQTSYLANRMRERGILMSTDGPHHNVIKIKPPMCFAQSNADFLIENLELVLSEDFMQI